MKKSLTILIFMSLIILTGCEARLVDYNLNEIPSESKELDNQEVFESREIKDSIEEDTTFNITLSFAGDTMLASFKDETKPDNFNDYVNNNNPSYFLEKVKPIFEMDDFTIVNLENVLSDATLEPVKKNYTPAYWYKSKSSNAEILKEGSVELACLSNNHTNDYGKEGYEDTKESVSKAGINYCDDKNITYIEKQGFKIAIINAGLWNEGQANSIANKVRTASKNADYKIVFFHGGKERIHTPEDWKVRATHKIIDAGADLVIGSHPHVLQPKEIYNDKEIIYSLGNFCYGGNKKPENRTIIFQKILTVDKEKLKVIKDNSKIIPCYVFEGNVNNYRPAIIENNNQKQHVIDFMNGLEEAPL